MAAKQRSSKSLWKRIFKSKPLPSAMDGQTVLESDVDTPTVSPTALPSQALEDCIDVAPLVVSQRPFHGFVGDSTPVSKTSKATLSTASTALSTVDGNNYGAPSNGHFMGHAANGQDELSYSCAASTAWTATVDNNNTNNNYSHNCNHNNNNNNHGHLRGTPTHTSLSCTTPHSSSSLSLKRVGIAHRPAQVITASTHWKKHTLPPHPQISFAQDNLPTANNAVTDQPTTTLPTTKFRSEPITMEHSPIGPRKSSRLSAVSKRDLGRTNGVTLNRGNHDRKPDNRTQLEEDDDGFKELICARQRSSCYKGIGNSSNFQQHLNNVDINRQPKENTSSMEIISPSSCAPGTDNKETGPLCNSFQQDPFDMEGFAKVVMLPPHDTLPTTTSMDPFRNYASKDHHALQNSITINNATTPTTPLSTPKLSSSPQGPPATHRKNIDVDFFTDKKDTSAPVLPVPPEKESPLPPVAVDQKQPSPTSAREFTMEEPQHLYAEINIRKRSPVSLTDRQRSGGSVSLAMTSISSLTGRSSLFPNGVLEGVGGSGGFWRIGNNNNSANAGAEENYFEYSAEDHHLRGSRGFNGGYQNSEGMFDLFTGVISQVFHNTCHCFEINNKGTEGLHGMELSSPIAYREGLVAGDTKTFNEMTLNDTTMAVVTGATGKSGIGYEQEATTPTKINGKKEPIFSLPMES